MSDKTIFWAIKNTDNAIGFYTGTWLTRQEAIREHIWLLSSGRQEIYSGPLTALEKTMWRRRQRLGDKAVKVRVVELDEATL